MGINYNEREINCDLCEKCPARQGTIFSGKLRGSSFRGRKIEKGEEFGVDACIIQVGEIAVAVVEIANKDDAAKEHDADFIFAKFEDEVTNCEGPTLELSGVHCTPVSTAFDNFVEVNYQSR